MPANAKLMVHAGGVRRTRDELAGLHTPQPTATWRPVPHANLVTELIRGLSRQGVMVVRDEYATMGPSDAKLFGVMDLVMPYLDTGDFRMALGVRGSNDKTLSIQVVAGCRVLVCDNMAFSSSGGIFLKKKHTNRLDLAAVVPRAIETFIERAGAFRLDIDRMRNLSLTDSRAKELLFDAFTGPAPIMPLRCLPMVSRLYFEDEEQRFKFADRSLWSLNNAMTEVVKSLKPIPQHNSGLAIGRFCGRVVHRAAPQPIAVIDGIEVYKD